ncbi:MAG TPA: Sec-independent protein translocase subunit TatA [Streptosporangiaceae bacterium]|jgi:sec-independent protein translocase protein TatA|nr:Sec-independent protein translocase subunit TatA [Streptosporangiaceae bacterium]
MIGDLFDSPWKILIVAVVLIVLFGSTKLPTAARSLGRSMRILKSEVQGLHGDDAEPEPAPPARAEAQPTAQQQITAAQQQTAQQQIDDLQQQLSKLKGASAGDQRTQQPS